MELQLNNDVTAYVSSLNILLFNSTRITGQLSITTCISSKQLWIYFWMDVLQFCVSHENHLKTVYSGTEGKISIPSKYLDKEEK